MKKNIVKKICLLLTIMLMSASSLLIRFPMTDRDHSATNTIYQHQNPLPFEDEEEI